VIVAGVVAVAIVVVGVGVWATFVREEAPAAFELSDGEGQAGGAAEGDSVGSESDGGEVTLDGQWVVSEGSEAGYRVVEDLGDILDFEAVGRTSDVSGTLEIAGVTVTAATFEVDVASIRSDDGRRDTQFRDKIMNADEFPTATFTLTTPLDLGTAPVEGERIATTAAGELTLRDATNPVTATIEAQVIEGQIELVASIPVLFSDYGIANPSNPLAEVRDEGQVEVQLFLVKG
jgi:polyisoprenoid-binding protein YceI